MKDAYMKDAQMTYQAYLMRKRAKEQNSNEGLQ
jgi:hypothetical protein